ncbi:ATP-binding protein [uncultured Cutibacterium sp.]|uniref:AlbA family DNA-binding domain-containing protein n=1 Tax=uncultured Cutibacterium sp. TaxID=1912223 RepID=UPI00338FBD40
MEWSETTLQGVLTELRARRGDTTLIEVKRASGGVPKMAETLCAFANMPDGGTVILGVDEAHGQFAVVGVTNIGAIEAGLAAQARDAVRPPPGVSDLHSRRQISRNCPCVATSNR